MTENTVTRTRPMLYLAVPYSDDSYAIRKGRFEVANVAASQLVQQGNHVFSPISHTHPIALQGNLPVDWEYWEEYDRIMLSVCTELVVLLIDGWLTSVGVQAEIKIAKETGMKISYMNPHTWVRGDIVHTMVRPSTYERRGNNNG